MIIPYKVDVPYYSRPIANWIILAATVVMYGITWDFPEWSEVLVLDGWQPWGLMGNLLLHADPIHLIGNMFFLYLFGNVVCARLNSVAYPFAYAGLGLAAAIAHNLLSDMPAIGASGAINGLVGMYVVWFPVNDISVFVWLGILVRPRVLHVAGFWVVLLFLAFDIWGAASGEGMVAYWAHLGGFAAGVALASLMTLAKWVDFEKGDRNLLVILGLAKPYEMYTRIEPGSVPIAADRISRPSRISVTPAAPAKISAARVSPPHHPNGSGTTAAGAEKRITVACSCGRVFAVASAHAGKQGKCPVCGQILQIPRR